MARPRNIHDEVATPPSSTNVVEVKSVKTVSTYTSANHMNSISSR